MLELCESIKLHEHDQAEEDRGAEEVGVQHLTKDVEVEALCVLDRQQIPRGKDAIDSDKEVSKKVELKVAPASNDSASKHQVNRSLLVHGHVNVQEVPLSKQCNNCGESP